VKWQKVSRHFSYSISLETSHSFTYPLLDITVHHVLPQRDNLVLCEEGKQINPDDASGAALEASLSEVAVRKCRLGDADQWELRKWAWNEYDPAFNHIR
jgi:hypothetical protein